MKVNHLHLFKWENSVTQSNCCPWLYQSWVPCSLSFFTPRETGNWTVIYGEGCSGCSLCDEKVYCTYLETLKNWGVGHIKGKKNRVKHGLENSLLDEGKNRKVMFALNRRIVCYIQIVWKGFEFKLTLLEGLYDPAHVSQGSNSPGWKASLLYHFSCRYFLTFFSVIDDFWFLPTHIMILHWYSPQFFIFIFY